MKIQSFPRATLVLALIAVLGLPGCWRRHTTFRRQDTTSTATDDQAKHPETLERVLVNAEKIRGALASSVHRKVDCSGCHDAADKREKPGDVGEGQCASCHVEEAKAYAETVHAKARAEGKEAATCTDCHGIHEVKRVSDPSASVAPRNLPHTCGNCHENPALAKKLGIKRPLAERNMSRASTASRSCNRAWSWHLRASIATARRTGSLKR